MQNATRGALSILFLVAIATFAAGQASDPVVGNWQLNVAKSKYTPGPGPKSETRTYTANGQASAKGVDAAGKATSTSWTILYDGQDRPLTGSPDADMLSLKRIDPYHVEFTQKRGGKVVMTGTRTISPDGKEMTIVTKGTDAKGQTVNNVEVFERR
jgi:hypothetical protein